MMRDAETVFNALRVTVLGAGRSGMAAARWLESAGARVTVSDRRPEEEWDREFVTWCRRQGIRVEAGGHSDRSCTACSVLVTSPGIPASAPPISKARDAGVMVVNDLVLSACFYKGKIVAVTGTNGKTTTTMLITHLLEEGGVKAVAAGNISPPLFEVMLRGEDQAVAVLEVSSFQLELLETEWNLPFEKPEISVAVWLNLASDHLDRHHDVQTYGECKAHLLDLQGPDDWSVLNVDDTGLMPWLHRGTGKRMFFGSRKPAYDSPCAWIGEGADDLILDLSRLAGGHRVTERYDISCWQLSGRHNIENLVAAVAAARLAGARPSGIREGIGTFQAPAHRFEKVAVRDGITYIDDSKATNVAAAVRALEAAPGPVVLIAGGLGKNEDYAPLASAVAALAERNMMRAVVLMGRQASDIDRAMSGVALPAYMAVELLPAIEDGRAVMYQAVKRARNLAYTGDVVLLSPACASFDMFSGYADRGDAFKDAVKDIACRREVPDTRLSSPHVV